MPQFETVKGRQFCFNNFAHNAIRKRHRLSVRPTYFELYNSFPFVIETISKYNACIAVAVRSLSLGKALRTCEYDRQSTARSSRNPKDIDLYFLREEILQALSCHLGQ
jgi:hypothetical protein